VTANTISVYPDNGSVATHPTGSESAGPDVASALTTYTGALPSLTHSSFVGRTCCIGGAGIMMLMTSVGTVSRIEAIMSFEPTPRLAATYTDRITIFLNACIHGMYTHAARTHTRMHGFKSSTCVPNAIGSHTSDLASISL
jgi:hypothetical protein